MNLISYLFVGSTLALFIGAIWYGGYAWLIDQLYEYFPTANIGTFAHLVILVTTLPLLLCVITQGLTRRLLNFCVKE